MNLRDHVGFLTELEARFPVDEWVAHGVRAWPLVRYHLSVSNLQIVNRTRSEADGVGLRLSALLRDEWRWARAEVDDRFHSESPASPADVLLYGDGVSQMFVGGAWHDRFCDPIAARAEALGLTTASWTPLNRFQVPRARSSWFIQPTLDALGAWCKLTHRLAGHDASLPGYDDFSAFVRERFPDARIPTPESVAKVAYYVEHHTRLYRRLLGRVRPRACFIVSYYGTERSSFVRACRQLRIPVVDVQHGYAGDRHWAYASWTRVPPGGYDLLPEVFWRWSEDEARVIDGWGAATGGAHRAEVSGNLFLSAWWQREFPGIDEATRTAAVVRSRAPDKRHLLFTLNGFEPPEMLDRLVAMFEKVRDRYFIWLRTHPSRTAQRDDLKRRFHALLPAAANIDEATSLPLPAVLAAVDVHLTEISTTVIEAELFGVPSVLLGELRSVLYPGQLGRGTARVATAIEDVPAVADALLSQHRTRSDGCFARSWDRLLLELVGDGPVHVQGTA